MSADTWVVISSVSGILSAIGTLVAAGFAAKSAKASMDAVREMEAARTLAMAPKIEIVGEKQIKVPFACIGTNATGLFIRGYGRLILDKGQFEKAGKEGGNVAFVCNDCTALNDGEYVYRATRVVPL